MTQYEKLEDFYFENQNVSKLRKYKLRVSVKELLSDGYTRTGESDFRRGWAYKEVWTQEISNILTKFGIKHQCGNDAQRGGACGEFVKVTSPAFIKAVKERNKRMSELVEENIDTFKSFNLHDIVPIVRLDRYWRLDWPKAWTAADAISESSGLDYQLCLWFARSKRFLELYKK